MPQLSRPALVRSARIRRRALSLTSLIDVIFLLLLFFMLTSTFTRFSEIQLSAAGSGAIALSDRPPLFLRLGAEALTLNGEETALSSLGSIVADLTDGPTTLLVSPADGVTSQRLVDLLVALGQSPDLTVTVLE